MRREPPAAGQTGIIVIQVDGLGREVLARALRRRLMPFTRRLLRKRGYRLIATRPGVPATTPAVQAALMYGVEGVVPGFRWFEKAAGRVRVMNNYEDIASVRGRLPEGRGLFRGGAVYSAFFSGGAERAVFTPGQTDPGPFAAPVKPGQVPLFLLRNLMPIGRILGLSVYELWLEILDYLSSLARGRPRRGEGLFPFERVAANAVLREVSTIGALAEVRRGCPAVFVNFVGFDVMAHHRGPRSLSAALALVTIDRKIRRIWRAARRARTRRYELYLLSDHGQTPTLPFERACGRSLREAILEHELAARVEDLGEAEYRRTVHAAAVLGHLRQLERLLPWPLGPLASFSAGRIEARLAESGRAAAASAAELLILPTGGLAHLYFPRRPGRLDLDAIEELHPGLVGHLARLPGVRAVLGRSRGRAVVRGAEGALVVGGEVTLTGSDPLAGAGPTEELARELAALAAHPQCGDLVVLAGKVGRRRVVRRGPVYANFLEELGGHGAVEPPEQGSFLICPDYRAGLFPPGCRPAQLYRGLCRVRWNEEAPA